jgi:PKD repeat protein
MKKHYAILLTVIVLVFSSKSFAAGGPDAYGYTWMTSLDAGGPAYNWIDITSRAGVQTVTGLADDNSAASMINVGFNFHYYWSDYSQLKIGSNGWMSFNNISNIASCFPTIPGAGGPGDNILAPLMGDLNFTGAGNIGQVKYWSNNVDSCVISYINVPFWSVNAPGWTGSNSFQVILCAADSSITYQYGSLSGFTANAACTDITVGIENSTGAIGLQVHSDALPPNNYAIKFSYPATVLLSIQDPFAKWNEQSNNKAVFIPRNFSHSLNANYANAGNTDVTTSVSLDVNILNAASTSVHNTTGNIPSLAAGDDSTYQFPASWTPTTSGQYTFQSALTNSQDINAANNTKNTELEVVDICTSSMLLSYLTTGIPNGSLNWNGGANDDGAAVYFAPPVYPYTVSALQYYISSNVSDGFIAQLYDDDGANGGPGTLLFTQTIPSVSVVTSNWNTVSVSTPVTLNDGGFYVVWIQTGTTIFLGTESNGPLSNRNYEILDGAWADYRENSIEEIYIRATINNYSASLVANFTQTTDHLDVEFENNSTGLYQSWAWDFGDGNISTAENPSHTYAAAGTYNVCLIVTNMCSADTICQTVTICDNAVADYISAGNELTVDFTDQSTGTVGSWAWDFGDGNTSTQQNPSHTFAFPGSYMVCLIAENSCGYNDTLCQSIAVCQNLAAGYSASSNGLSVDFTDQSGVNPETWTWDFGDGNTSTLQNPAHLYAAAGTYNVCLIVTNACGEAESICQTITVCGLPVADFTFSDNGLEVDFTDESDLAVAWQWIFGDGGTSTQQNPTHVYANGGTYEVCLIVVNNCGESDTICEQVTIDNISVSENEQLVMSAYPNPAEDVLNIVFTSELQHATLEVTDLTGKIVWSETNFSGASAQVDASEWSAGLYRIRVIHETGTGILNFVKK